MPCAAVGSGGYLGWSRVILAVSGVLWTSCKRGVAEIAAHYEVAKRTLRMGQAAPVAAGTALVMKHLV